MLLKFCSYIAYIACNNTKEVFNKQMRHFHTFLVQVFALVS